ncbi:hypothetical protein CA11_26810 [Gimesia maris]|uniref:hypothetical protein n=1 Tax=Gimesia maris TaxID=122 RepID=UPI001188A11F|nr:hypothetical protein [Gimesia maris]QDU14869.1 hypothetical protein CA11_26810 [Gimesia maris]
MSTTLSHNGVCDTLYVSPVDQLFQRSTNWSALEPVTAPPFGNPVPDDMLRIEAPRHNWPVYLVNVPEDWKPQSWRSVPPNTPTYKKAKTAAEVASILNRERIANSKDGFVSHWHIRVRVGSKYANLSVSLPTPWKPKNEYDLPPAFITLDGPRGQCEQIVGDLNRRLDQCGDGEIRKRAFIARSINPADLKPIEQKGDTVSPLNEPAELPEEIEGPPELYEVHEGHTFDVNPSCGEEVLIRVFNTSDPEKARQKAERYLKLHAQDLLEWGQLDPEAAAPDLLKHHGLQIYRPVTDSEKHQ